MTNTLTWRLLATIGTALTLGGCISGEQTLAALRADGNHYYGRGEYAQALPYYEQYLDRKPEAVDVRSRVADTLRHLGRPGDAERYTRTVYDVDPTRLDHAADLAAAQVEAGQVGEGLDFLRRYLQEYPTSEGYFRLADIAGGAGLPDDALRAYKIAVRLDGLTSAEPHRRIARFYETHDHNEQAIEHWRAVLWFNANDADARDAVRSLGQVPGPSFVLNPNSIKD